MYIRTQDEALRAVAEILDLPERRLQIVQSTVKIMLCLDAEPRTFMADCQALLIEGGLEELRRRRRSALETQEMIPLVVLDPEGDRLFEAAAAGLDALRLGEVVRQVFPDLRHERWVVARALLGREAEIQARLSDAIKSRDDREAFRGARVAVEALLVSQHPAWADRAGTLRAACVDVLKGAQLADPDRIHEEADLLFQIVALSDERASGLLSSIDADPAEAVHAIHRLYEAIDAVRGLDPRPSELRQAA